MVDIPPTSVPIMIHDTPVNGRERPATEKSAADFILVEPLIAKNVMMAKVITNVA